MARFGATGADLGTGHKNNIRWMTVPTDEYYENQDINILYYIFLILVVLFIIDIAIYIVQIIDTPHKFRTYVSFTGMHIIITHVYVCPKQVVLRENGTFHY